MNGYIQDFRIYKGAAKYDGDFVVPSRSPDILPDTPSGVSGGSKLAKITDGAVSFDGTGDYLEVADNADFEMGTDDFTIEAFFYNQENAVQSMVTKYGDTVSTRSFWLGTLNVPQIHLFIGIMAVTHIILMEQQELSHLISGVMLLPKELLEISIFLLTVK